jgi:hypothetical protein
MVAQGAARMLARIFAWLAMIVAVPGAAYAVFVPDAD